MTKSLFKLFHPEYFQGSLNKPDYFEGWYFKNVSCDMRHAVAFIPGVSLTAEPHAFIQYIDGINQQSAYFKFKKESFEYSKKALHIKIGKSVFTDRKITIDVENDTYSIKGELQFSGHIRFPKTLLRPGIMGWYSFVPSMECNHGVVSLHHDIKGAITVNGVKSDFTEGNGYIEKDWGTSFPEAWIWLQCNNFDRERISLMVSIAKIPWRGRFFIGLIAYISIDGHTEIFATYNRATVSSLKQEGDNITKIILSRGKRELSIKVIKQEAATLIAPENGVMTKTIKESLNSSIEVSYRDKKGAEILLRGTNAGYEEIETIFSYFDKH